MMMGIIARMETFHPIAAIDKYTSSNIRIQFPGHKHHAKKNGSRGPSSLCNHFGSKFVLN